VGQLHEAILTSPLSFGAPRDTFGRRGEAEDDNPAHRNRATDPFLRSGNRVFFGIRLGVGLGIGGEDDI
jgi:hypothetical protein